MLLEGGERVEADDGYHGEQVSINFSEEPSDSTEVVASAEEEGMGEGTSLDNRLQM